MILDPKGLVLTWNQGAERIKGYRADEIVGNSFTCFYTQEDRDSGHPEAELKQAAEAGRFEEEGWRVRKDGTSFFASVVITALFDEQGQLTGFGKVTRDITTRREAEQEQAKRLTRVEAIARTDALTGLPNRRAWDEEVRREIARAARLEHSLAVALLDLDHFKLYNDERGHPAGDALLREAAQEWRLRLRVNDFIARYGGEEFAVALPECSAETATEVIERIRDGTPQGQTCSAGLVMWNRGEVAEAVVSRADAALYGAKQTGRNRTVIA
jgi:diguanylate cyclase (GGDEF)-like protein/PAS domain S-box-containing protein